MAASAYRANKKLISRIMREFHVRHTMLTWVIEIH